MLNTNFDKAAFSDMLTTAYNNATNNGQDHNISVPDILQRMVNEIFESEAVFITKTNAENTYFISNAQVQENLKGFKEKNSAIASKGYIETMSLIFLSAIILVLAGLHLNGLLSSNNFIYGSVGSAILGVGVHGWCQYERQIYNKSLMEDLRTLFMGDNDEDVDVVQSDVKSRVDQ